MHHKESLEKMNTQMKLHQLENMETTDEHAQMISSLEDRVAELSSAVELHAEVLDDHHDQLNEVRQPKNNKQYQNVVDVQNMAPKRRR